MGIPAQIRDDARKHFLRIRELNDALRTTTEPLGALIMNGTVAITANLAALGEPFVSRCLKAVRNFTDFDAQNDPYGEHDMAFLTVDEQDIFWKIDYFDRHLQMHSPDPSDAGVTRRVLTVGLADDY